MFSLKISVYLYLAEMNSCIAYSISIEILEKFENQVVYMATEVQILRISSVS
jgi:hypothetical protein